MRNRILTTLVFAPLLLASAGRANAATIAFTSVMLGSNETPPNSSTATGAGTFVFDTAAMTIGYSISYSGLTAPVAAAHIHAGLPGVAGPIILPFIPSPTGTSGSISGTLTAANLINQGTSGISTFAQIFTAAQTNDLYSNIHDFNFPAGEIRGQLVAATVTPEPGTIVMLAMGAALLTPVLRKRHRK